jgi:hypothetical protein
MYIITGMHRSGTSLVSQLLYNMGANFGPEDELLAANKWNVKGYYENKRIVDLNNKLIVGDQSSIEDWIAANEQGNFLRGLRWSLNKIHYLNLPGTETILARARNKQQVFNQLMERFPALVTKDTRFSLTVAAWQKYGSIDRILYVFRHPSEVVRSLRRREKMPLWFGYRQWTIHVKRFFESADLDRTILFYYNNLSDPEKCMNEVRRLFRFLGRDWTLKSGEDLLERTFDRSLRHHVTEEASLPKEVRHRFEDLLKKHRIYTGETVQ